MGKIYFLLALICAVPLLNADSVSSCSNLNLSDTTYTLGQSLNASYTCFNITAQNVTLDCAGFTISGNTTNTSGVYSNGQYTTVKNCNINGFKYGIYLNGAAYSVIANNSAISYFTGGHGIYVRNSNYSSVSGTTGWYNLTDSSGSAGIYLDASSYSNITGSAAISGLSQISFGALALSNSNFNIISNSTGNSSNDASGIWLSSSNNNTLQDCVGYTASGSNLRAGIRLDGSYGNTVINCSGRGNLASFALTGGANYNLLNSTTGTLNTTSSGRYVYLVQNSANNTLINLRAQLLNTGGYAIYLDSSNFTFLRDTFISSRSHETLYLRNSNSNSFANSTFNSTSSSNNLVFLGNSRSNAFQNITLLSPSRPMLYINSSSGGNLFFWCNFTQTSGLYVNDTNGSNLFNSTVLGQPEGNIWADVINGSVEVTGSNLANYGYGLYVGNAGAGVPYNSSKTAKLSGNVADYAPLTPNSTSSNTPPQISAISIYPVSPSINSSIYCNITATDAQQSILTINYTWNHNGSAHSGSSALSNNNTPLAVSLQLNSSLTAIGANWSCSAFASDGFNLSATNFSSNITVVAIPPAYDSLSNNGSTAKYGDAVSWNVTFSDLVSLSSYTFSSNMSGSWGNETPVPISGAFHSASAWKQVLFTNGSLLCGKFYFNNSAGMNNMTSLSCFTVSDSPPVATVSNITANQDPVYPDSTLIGTCNATDVDGNPVYYKYNWYVGGALSASGSTGYYPPGTAVNVGNITSGLSPGQTWVLECVASDGQLNSTPLNSSGMLIVSYPWQVMNVTIVFANPPSRYSVDIAPLKHNKSFAFSWVCDDAYVSCYDPTVNYMDGGFVSYENMRHPGKYFTDGAGNLVPFRGGIGWFSFNITETDQQHVRFGTYFMSWLQLNQSVRRGWEVDNHDEEITYNRELVINRTGYNSTQYPLPNGNESYTDPALAAGMLGIYKQDGTFHYNGGNTTRTVPTSGVNVTGALNLTQYMMYREYYTGAMGPDNVSNYPDMLANKSVNGSYFWGSGFSHTVQASGPTFNMALFKSLMDKLESRYGYLGNDTAWVAGIQEVYEYLYVRQNLAYNSRLNGSNLTISVNPTSNLPTWLRNRATTLLVSSDANITSISFTYGFTNYTFVGVGNSSALINLEWGNYTPSDLQGRAAEAVSIAEATQFNYDIDGAQRWVSILPPGAPRTALQSRLNALSARRPAVGIDFGWKSNPNVPGIWNHVSRNYDNMTGIQNFSEANTSISMTITKSFNKGGYEDGFYTGNDSGIFLDSQLFRGVWGNGSNGKVRIDGLNTSSRYNIYIYASTTKAMGGNRTTTIYSSGNQSSSLECYQNSNRTANLIGLQPDSNGTIELDASPSALSVNYLAFLGGMAIEEVQNSTAPNLPPTITQISISPPGPNSSSNMVCNITGASPANATLIINATWVKNGAAYFSASNSSALNNTPTIFQLLLNASFTQPGDNWSCAAFAFDGANSSAINYSANTTISKYPDTIALLLNGSPSNISYSYSPSFSLSVFANSASGTHQLYLNGTAVASNYAAVMSAGSYEFIANSTGNANYTPAQTISNVAVSLATSSITLSARSWSVQFGGQSNITCSIDNNQAAFYLYRDGALVASGTGTELSDAQTLALGTYTYACNSSASQNYSAASGRSGVLSVTSSPAPAPSPSPSNHNGGGNVYTPRTLPAVSIEKNTAPPVKNQTQNVTGAEPEWKAAATQAISDAEAALNKAMGSGKDTSEAVWKYAAAKDALATGDYERAQQLAKEAAQLATNAVQRATSRQSGAGASPPLAPSSGDLPLGGAAQTILAGGVVILFLIAGYLLFFRELKKRG